MTTPVEATRPCTECKHLDPQNVDGSEAFCRLREDYVVPTSTEPCGDFSALCAPSTIDATRERIDALVAMSSNALRRATQTHPLDGDVMMARLAVAELREILATDPRSLNRSPSTPETKDEHR